jgi:hypothetical protein
VVCHPDGLTALDGDRSTQQRAGDRFDRFDRILDGIGWPASLRDIDTGESVLGPATLGGKALDDLQLVGQTEVGHFYDAADGMVRLVGRANLLTESAYTTSGTTFGDSGAEMKYHNATFDSANIANVHNGGRVSRQGGIIQEYRDANSESKYGPRDLEVSGLLMATDSEAYVRGDFACAPREGSRIAGRPTHHHSGSGPSNLWAKVLGYELGQKVTVKRRPQGVGSAISKDVHVEGIRHEVDAGSRSWVTTWLCSPADPNEDLWAIVDSAIVGTSIVAW